jgi:N-acetylmuramic acid 6-phosphate etherase
VKKQSGKKLFEQLQHLSTERRNKNSSNIDTMSVSQVLKVINAEDQKVALAVKKEIPSIARAVEIIVNALKNGGRLVYVGAGTSGRLGILDAAECPPTFGTDPSLIVGLIAGGKKAVFRSQEGAEDKTESARRDIKKIGVNRNDVVCGIAASLRTPYVVTAMKEAKNRGAKTIYVTTNPRSVLRRKEFANVRMSIDVAICPDVGPEVIMGSTRMKSGTAQKLVLNMLTTTSMIRLGKVYENMMVDLQMNSRKLEERAKRVLMIATGVPYDVAHEALKKANGHVKTAIVMIKANVSALEAKRRLRRSNGFVRKAIENQ